MTDNWLVDRNAYYESLSGDQKKSFDALATLLTSKYPADLFGGVTADGILFYRNPDNHKLEPMLWKNKAE